MSIFLKAKFLNVCPYGKQYLDKIVDECKRDMLLLAGLAVIVLILWNGLFGSFSKLYLLESIGLALYIVGMEVPNFRLQERENKVYRELLIYFSRVKHRYLACRHMANAVMDAADGMVYEIQRLADEIYQVLMESNRKENVREYILYHKTNRYLKLFLIQAYEVSEKGDMYFAENIENLRLELMEEIYRRKRRAHEFAGYTFVTVTPFFMMPVLKQWGLEFTPELEFFYAGTGVLLELVTFIVTNIVYGMIIRAKEITLFARQSGERIFNTDFFYENSKVLAAMKRLEKLEGKISSRIRQLILQSGERTSFGKLSFQILLLMSSAFLVLTMFVAKTHDKERRIVLEKVDSIETIAPVASEEKQAILATHILEVTRQCCEKTDTTEEEIKSLLRERIRLGNESMEQAAVQEIKNKLAQYEKAKGSFWEVVFCLFGSIGVGLIPLLQLVYQAKTIQAGAVYEVRQFQAIILMERKLQGITIMGLLEDMEVFSQCFRGSLRRCINSYGAGPKKALVRLKEEGRALHESFEELADAFLSVDEVGIEAAFAEVESNRRLLEKMTQLEAEISMERKKDNTDLLAKIPMLLAVGAYFILPFFMYSLSGVYEVFELLEEMKL